MKKIAIIITAIVSITILLAGIFSAGVVVGNLVLPQGLEISERLVDLPLIRQQEISDEQNKEPTGGLFDNPTDTETATETDQPHSDIDIQEDTPQDRPQNPTPPSIDVPPPSTNLEDLFVPFWETWDIVHENYVDQPVDDEAMMVGAIQGMIEAMQIPTDTLEAEVVGIDEYIQEGGTPEDLETLFIPFWKNWALTHMINDQELVQGAISGMLNSLGDPHTSYMDPEDYREATTTFEGEEEYEGIGAWVDVSKDYLTIITPFPDSPAEESGLEPGDKIIAIDGEDMTGIDGELVRQKVLGPAGTTITLTIKRAGMDHFDVDVTRGSIIVPSVEARMLEDDIAYLRLYLFGEKSDEEVREALRDLLENDPVGLIFDLRYNGGGGVPTAVAVASEFIEEGVIFYEIYGDGSRDTYEADGKGLATEIPLVVLVNEGSASASEIVAGAIQDYGRAPLVGTTTFGKGSVQLWIPLSNNQGAVRVTVASWVTPDERLIHQIGLEPDVPIMGIRQSLIDEGFDISALEIDPEDIVILTEEEYQQGLDVQLEKAKEILLEDIK
jgi:carboxyl-terminal processing protease